jgi:hypothetical protein
MILEFQKPIPVVTPLGDGYVIYVTNCGMWENDVWTVALEKSGQIKHFTTDQLKIYQNLTFDIKKVDNL